MLYLKRAEQKQQDALKISFGARTPNRTIEHTRCAARSVRIHA